jgi:multiple sugar transport system substrate-binding protein
VKKTIYFIFCALVLSTTLSCNKPSSEKSKTVVTEVIFWHAMSSVVGDLLNAMISDFNRSHPGIRVVGQSMGGYNALSQKLMASIIAGNQPDIAQAYEAWIAKFVQAGLLVPFDTFITNLKTFEDDFYPAIVEDNLYDGRLMSLPFNKSTPILYYNTDLFRKAGLDPQKPPATWDEFRDMSVLLSKSMRKDGGTGSGFAANVNVSEYECFLMQAGGALVQASNSRKFAFNSEEAVQAVRYLLDLKFLHQGADFYPSAGYEYQNDFLSKRSAIMMSSCVARSYLLNRITFNWNIAPLPAGKKKAAIIYGTNIVLFSRSSPEKQKAAWKFIEWFTSASNMVRWTLGTGYLPVRRSALRDPRISAEGAKNPAILAIFKQLENGFNDPKTPEWYTARMNLDKVLSDIFLSSDVHRAYGEYHRNFSKTPQKKKELLEELDKILSVAIKKELDRAVKQSEKWML